MVSGGSESERQLRGISTLNALRADGAITSFRVKAPHKSRWAFIVRLLRGAFIIVLVQWSAKDEQAPPAPGAGELALR